jgi:hypothetical protein
MEDRLKAEELRQTCRNRSWSVESFAHSNTVNAKPDTNCSLTNSFCFFGLRIADA